MKTRTRVQTLLGATLVATLSAVQAGTAMDIDTASESHAIVTVGTINAQPGDLVDVSIELDADDLVGAFVINANAADLMIDDVMYDGPLFQNGWEGWDTAPSLNPNVSGACIFTEDQVTGEQQLVSLRLMIPEDAEVGSFIPVTLSGVQVSNYSFTPFEITVVNGGINIEGEELCGADIAGGDGVVNADDLLMMISAWGACTDDCSADLNEDSMVGVDDLLMLLSAWGPCS